MDTYQNLHPYIGDLHNHCGLSYGHGPFQAALRNARLQLDFVSVTPHAVWPDIPENDPRLDYLVAYHRFGFQRAKENWPGYLAEVEKLNQDGTFVIFPSFEWHSNAFGDHCIYYKNGQGQEILEALTLPALREALRRLDTPAFVIPHHIGYQKGYRGINWAAFSSELSPVVEIFSFHGSSESSDAPYPYYHAMGPRDGRGTAQFGWAQGHTFGVIGSTDNHNAFPGSYGSGRLGVWAEALTRDAIWAAIQNRHTYALTGDRISLAFALNGNPMGSICPPNSKRRIEVAVTGGDAIDYIEVLHNNSVLHRECPLPSGAKDKRFKVYLELGWGEKPEATPWDVAFSVQGGRLISIEPRFRGFTGQGTPDDDEYAYTQWEQPSSHTIHFTTHTRPNLSPRHPATEGLSLEIEGGPETTLIATVNGTDYVHTLAELAGGSRSHYLGGFVSPAFCFHRAVPASEYQHQFAFVYQHHPTGRDWYTVRVRQKNDQWAWSSPIWVEA